MGLLDVTREKVDIFDRATEGGATVLCGQGAKGTLEVLCVSQKNFAAQVESPGDCRARDR